MPRQLLVRRVIYMLAVLAPLWGLISLTVGGFVWRFGPVRLSSNNAARPIVIGAVAAVYYLLRSSRDDQASDGLWLVKIGKRLAVLAIPIVVALGFVAGAYFGSYAASESDAYGYLSQARLWLRGDLLVRQPNVTEFDWPDRALIFSPFGYRPISEDGTIVPTYAPGLPMLMAAFHVFGENGPFFVVPIFASLALACTYLLGQRATGSKVAGVLATLFLLTSPTFLTHETLPMSDVVAAAGWSVVCVMALREPVPRPLAAGLFAGAALLVRPNLLLLGLAPIIGWACAPSRKHLATHVAWFGAGMLPGVLAVAAVNTYLYGSPLVSGYGTLEQTYYFSAAPENIRNYTGSLLKTQTPLVLLAVVPFFVAGMLRRNELLSSARACLVATIALTFISYLFYQPFTLWHFLRFLLPAFPALFVLMAAAIRGLALRVPPVARAPAVLYVCVACILATLPYSQDVLQLKQRAFHQRGVNAARQLAAITPANAMIFAVTHSGVVRYYTGMTTARFDWMPAESLDIAVRDVRAKGRAAYLVLDDWEEPGFRRKFAAHSAIGQLTSWPLARVPGIPEVRIYDLNGP